MPKVEDLIPVTLICLWPIQRHSSVLQRDVAEEMPIRKLRKNPGR